MAFWSHRPRLGTILLGVFLVATGVLQLVPALNFSGSGTVLAILAIAAGVLILLER
jgi:hypothetical protein